MGKAWALDALALAALAVEALAVEPMEALAVVGGNPSCWRCAAATGCCAGAADTGPVLATLLELPWLSSLMPMGSSFGAGSLLAAAGGWSTGISTTKCCLELVAGAASGGSSGSASGGSLSWSVVSKSLGSTSMACALAAPGLGGSVPLLLLLPVLALLDWLLLLWLPAWLTTVGLVMPLAGLLGTSLASLSVWLPLVVDMAGENAHWQRKLLAKLCWCLII